MLVDVFTQFVDKLLKAQINLQEPSLCYSRQYSFLLIVTYFFTAYLLTHSPAALAL